MKDIDSGGCHLLNVPAQPAPIPPPPPSPATDWQMIGSFADWSTAIIALLAFAVASFAARATIQTNRAQQQTLELQRQQFEQAEERRYRAQAEKAIIWKEWRDHTQTPTGWALRVVNVSELPVYQVCVAMQQDLYGDVLGNPTRIMFEEVIFPTDAEGTIISLAILAGYAPPIAVYFWDAAGVAWVRYGNAKLREPTQSELTALYGQDFKPFSKDDE